MLPSRASPLPHLTEFFHENAVECGSGLAREGARLGNTSSELNAHHRIRTPRLPINPFKSLSSTSLL
ncbi:hypothetical protein EAH78_29155 [Pseudomonas arsenicoxydans]|uniref:Uncharacterized protein n=1 Tax=Pseudomonas arsenicoxydans TaxID=702115 RepID=A0A502H1Z9_9PSED|nr:hypothetical protein EAH78_29155 [Pseudomonas arsenicoxydans]